MKRCFVAPLNVHKSRTSGWRLWFLRRHVASVFQEPTLLCFLCSLLPCHFWATHLLRNTTWVYVGLGVRCRSLYCCLLWNFYEIIPVYKATHVWWQIEISQFWPFLATIISHNSNFRKTQCKYYFTYLTVIPTFGGVAKSVPRVHPL